LKCEWFSKDVLGQQRLAPPRLRGHRRHRRRVAEDDLRVAHEEEVRDREEIELRQLARALVARDPAMSTPRAHRGLLQQLRRARPQSVALREIAHDARFASSSRALLEQILRS
jgi:hypothetical protein